IFSFGIEPSITRTYGASSSPRAAWRKGFKNSSPPSVGERTLWWRCTFGRPGSSPSTTSSSAGSVAAVMETVSPSQLIPSEIHRMCSSSTPAGGWISSYPGIALLASTALPPCNQNGFVQELQRLDEQLVAGNNVDADASALRACKRELRHIALELAPRAVDARRDVLDIQPRALHSRPGGDEAERELQRVGHDLAQPADLDLDARDDSSLRVVASDRDDCVGNRELVHVSAPHRLVEGPFEREVVGRCELLRSLPLVDEDLLGHLGGVVIADALRHTLQELVHRDLEVLEPIRDRNDLRRGIRVGDRTGADLCSRQTPAQVLHQGARLAVRLEPVL